MNKLILEFKRFYNKKIAKKFLDKDYYQLLHDHSSGYRSNNWLVGEDRLLAAIEGRTLCEIGFGNGQFLRKAAASAAKAYGIDWAVSPAAADMPGNVEMLIGDVTAMQLPEVDIFCSGDVLEHFEKPALRALIARVHATGARQYHVIACYDDTHSHLTIEPAEWWHGFFEEVCASPFRFRKENRERHGDIVIIENLE